MCIYYASIFFFWLVLLIFTHRMVECVSLTVQDTVDSMLSLDVSVHVPTIGTT